MEIKMEKKIVKNKIEKKQYDNVSKMIKVSKFNVLVETKSSILVKIEKGVEVWINKKFAYASNYTNFININIISSFDYSTSDEKTTYSGQAIIDYFEDKEKEKAEAINNNEDVVNEIQEELANA